MARGKAYRAALKQLADNGHCSGCNCSEPLTNSHRIPGRLRRDLENDPANIDRYCINCHLKCEGGRYEELNNGSEVVTYIAKMDPQYLEIKNLKFEPRMGSHIKTYFDL